jgi:hypothetical protein
MDGKCMIIDQGKSITKKYKNLLYPSSKLDNFLKPLMHKQICEDGHIQFRDVCFHSIFCCSKIKKLSPVLAFFIIAKFKQTSSVALMDFTLIVFVKKRIFIPTFFHFQVDSNFR